jgi:uncharacterized surface anchored protein
MLKKIVGILICMLLITNILCFPAIAIDEESNYEQDFNIEFIFAFGRVRDVEKYPEELFYQFRSVSLLIVWF